MAQVEPKGKINPSNFKFGSVIGEGSFSTVYLAQEAKSGRQLAIKVCEMRHIIREKKQKYIMIEKKVLSLLDHPYFVKMFYTFKDSERLYFALSYAENGELNTHIKKLGRFSIPCSQFYASEMLLALEYLHDRQVIHRDMKPENILLDKEWHIKITDFGSSKILNKETEEITDAKKRRNSFVGTAQYVSPEVLLGREPTHCVDLWALGCIIFQMVTGDMPFNGSNEYAIFQKVIEGDFKFPKDIEATVKDLVSSLLVLNELDRLGTKKTSDVKLHSFFNDIAWASLPTITAPLAVLDLPSSAKKVPDWDHLPVGYDPNIDFLTLESTSLSLSTEMEATTENMKSKLNCSSVGLSAEATADEDSQLKATGDNAFSALVDGKQIIKQSLLDMKKGLFTKRRMFLLTEGPHLYYVDPQSMTLKGEIPWSKDLKIEPKNFKAFLIHTPKKTYFLEDPENHAETWCKQINEVRHRYFSHD